MIGFVLLAFLIGGILGMMGMAVLTYGSKMNMFRENNVLTKRLDFLEHEGAKKRFEPVKDPRPKVHELVN